jgi:hypothetical protein
MLGCAAECLIVLLAEALVAKDATRARKTVTALEDGSVRWLLMEVERQFDSAHNGYGLPRGLEERRVTEYAAMGVAWLSDIEWPTLILTSTTDEGTKDPDLGATGVTGDSGAGVVSYG